MSNPIRPFMWGNQKLFLAGAKVLADSVFTKLDVALKPQVFLVGFRQTDRADRYPICLEPESCGYLPEAFSGVPGRAGELPPTEYLVDAPPALEERWERAERALAIQRALQEVLDASDESRGVFSYCSLPVQVEDDYLVSVVLQLSRDAVDRHPRLAGTRQDRYQPVVSLLDAAVTEFLEYGSESLAYRDPGSDPSRGVGRSNEVLRAAGASFCRSAAWAAKNVDGYYALYSWCNRLAVMPYEGRPTSGRMIVAAVGHPSVVNTCEFAAPPRVADFGVARKLLEVSKGPESLVTDSYAIRGVGRQSPNYDRRREDLFEIEFVRHGTWQLKHGSTILMEVVYGDPQLPRRRLDDDDVVAKLTTTLGNIDDLDVNKIVTVIREAIEQTHGTMIIVTPRASDEAIRLSAHGLPVVPIAANQEFVRGATAIDGALLIDPQGQCHAIGVIVDGDATNVGATGRGARYNSALKYVDSHPEAVAIVVSTDGPVDVVTAKRSQ